VDAPAANVSTDVGDLAPLDWSLLADASNPVDPATFAADRAELAADPAFAADPAALADPADPASVAADAAAIVAAATATAPLLTEEQRAILDFERQWWRLPGAKEQAIRDHFEMSPTRYYQTLNALLDVPEALVYDATLVNRLRRVRSSGPRARRLGPAPRSVS